MIIGRISAAKAGRARLKIAREVSGKPGASLFFIPKGALTHHLLKQAVVALPLVGHVRSPRGIAAPAGAVGQGCICAKLPALPMQSAQGVPFWKPLFMGWYIATPSHACLRQPATGSLTQKGWNESLHPCWRWSHFTTYWAKTRVPCFGAPLSGRGQGDLWRFIIWRPK